MTDEAGELESAIGAIGAAREPLVETGLDSGPASVPIWIVRVGDGLYGRSFHGERAAWFRHAIATGATTITVGDRAVPAGVTVIGDLLRDAIDDAYRAKYAANPADAPHVPPMLGDAAVATTVRFEPR